VVRGDTPSLLELPPVSRARITFWCVATVIVLLGILAWFVVRPLVLGSGDAGVTAQLSPTASAVPGHGTLKLPWTSNTGLYRSSVTKMEPKQDSCGESRERRAGRGWCCTAVSRGRVLHPRFFRLLRLGCQNSDGVRRSPTATAARWTKALDDGSSGSASLDLSQIGPPWWELVAEAPPIGKAAGGC
jgi:hypothetical protein